ncbi:MAG: hypothetical protein HQK95_06795 [Nitrospirae bacterium]|nr:hypothetical protein [Nitrospirota bacterium]
MTKYSKLKISVCLLLVSCLCFTIVYADQDESPEASSSSQYDGSWIAITSQGKGISFTVVGGKLTYISDNFTATSTSGSSTCTGSASISFTMTPGSDVSTGAVSLNYDEADPTTFQGTLSSNGTASGKWTFTYKSSGGFGIPSCTATSSGTWNAILSTSDTVYSNAALRIYDLSVQYSTFFGTKTGSVTSVTTTNGTYYVQLFTNGTAILAGADGFMYFYSGGSWNSFWVTWKTISDSDRVTTIINTIYGQFASYLGTKSGAVTSGTYNGGTYYVQYFTNGGFLIAWTDGYVYYYNGGAWIPCGVQWKS